MAGEIGLLGDEPRVMPTSRDEHILTTQNLIPAIPDYIYYQ